MTPVRFSLLLLLSALSAVQAQELPGSATPRGVVVAFLRETASESPAINRGMFARRVIGEMADRDVRMWRGLLPTVTPFRVDSIPRLSDDGMGPRTVAYVTVGSGESRETWSFFLRGDSIWKLESLRRYPSPEQKEQITRALAELDTATIAGRRRRSELERLALCDDTLKTMFGRCSGDLDKVIQPLERGQLWRSFGLEEVNFSALEEYRELDDDIADSTRQFYTLDGRALERLKSQLGVIAVERRSSTIALVLARYDGGSVGFLRANDPSQLPALSPNGYIMLRPVASGWWAYRSVSSDAL